MSKIETGKEPMASAERVAKPMEWMKNNLPLTEAHEKSVHEINLKYANKTEELRKVMDLETKSLTSLRATMKLKKKI